MTFIGIFGLIIYLISQKNINFKNKKLKESIKYISGAAILTGILVHYFYIKAMSKTKYTTLVVLMTYVIPLLIVGILSTIFLKEKMNMGMILGMVICLIGIIIFVLNSNN